jgi:hypothetical protein
VIGEDSHFAALQGFVVEIEAEVAGVGAAFRVDDHVVGKKRRHGAQIGVNRYRAVGRALQHPALRHRDDQEGAVRRPAEARRRIIVERELDADVAGERDRLDRPRVEIAEPEPPVPPARGLAEV